MTLYQCWIEGDTDMESCKPRSCKKLTAEKSCLFQEVKRLSSCAFIDDKKSSYVITVNYNMQIGPEMAPAKSGLDLNENFLVVNKQTGKNWGIQQGGVVSLVSLKISIYCSLASICVYITDGLLIPNK